MADTARPVRPPADEAGNRPTPTAVVPGDPRDRRVGATLTCLALAVFAFGARLRFVNGTFSGDEPHYLAFNVALQKYHSLDVVPVYAHQDYSAFYRGQLQPHLVAGPDGFISMHGFGGPVLWHLPYLAAGPFGAVLFMAGVAALTVLNIFLFLRQLGIVRGCAALVAGVFALGSPIFVYSSMLFIEPLAALAVLYAVRIVLAHRPTGWRVALASAGVSVLPWVHGRFVLFTAGGLALLAWRVCWPREGRAGRSWRANPLVLWAAVPAIVFLGGYVAYDLAIWHTINPAAGNAAHGDGLFGIPVSRGLAALMLDRGYGLVPNFPVFAAVLPGILLTLRRGLRTVQVVLAVMIVPTLVAVASFNGWWAGYSPPARFLVAIAPLLSWYVAVLLQRLRHWLADTVVVVLGLCSFAVGLTADVVPELKFHESAQWNTAMGYVGGLLGLGDGWQHALPSAFAQTGPHLFARWMVALALGGAGIALLASYLPEHRTSRPDLVRASRSTAPQRDS